MIRKFAVLGATALACSMLGGGVAVASTAPPVGFLSCAAAPSAVTFKLPVPAAAQAPDPKATTMTLKNAGTTACANAGVTGGKAPITGAVVTLNAKLSINANCAFLLTAVNLTKASLTVKLVNTTAGKTSTVATVKPINVTVTPESDFNSLVALDVHGVIPQTSSTPKPFGLEHFDMTLLVGNTADTDACTTPGATTPLTHIDVAPTSGFVIS